MGLQKITHEAVSNPEQLRKLIKAMDTEMDSIRAAVNEINTWAETLAAKLNLDAGVTDENYDAVITAGQVSESAE